MNSVQLKYVLIKIKTTAKHIRVSILEKSSIFLVFVQKNILPHLIKFNQKITN